MLTLKPRLVIPCTAIQVLSPVKTPGSRKIVRDIVNNGVAAEDLSAILPCERTFRRSRFKWHRKDTLTSKCYPMIWQLSSQRQYSVLRIRSLYMPLLFTISSSLLIPVWRLKFLPFACNSLFREGPCSTLRSGARFVPTKPHRRTGRSSSGHVSAPLLFEEFIRILTILSGQQNAKMSQALLIRPSGDQFIGCAVNIVDGGQMK